MTRKKFRRYMYVTAETETTFIAYCYDDSFTVVYTSAPAYLFSDIIRLQKVFTDDREAFEIVNEVKKELEFARKINLS